MALRKVSTKDKQRFHVKDSTLVDFETSNEFIYFYDQNKGKLSIMGVSPTGNPAQMDIDSISTPKEAEKAIEITSNLNGWNNIKDWMELKGNYDWTIVTENESCNNEMVRLPSMDEYLKGNTKIGLNEDSPWTHDTLNPDFWYGMDLDQSVRERLLEVSKKFYDYLGVPAKVHDIQLTGSAVNYNYHSQSDLDTHILIDFSEINPDIKLARNMVDNKRWRWNIEHKIIIRGYEVEMYVQDVKDPHTASGLYSLLNNKWIKEPDYKEPQTDPKDVEMKANQFKIEIDQIEAEMNNVDSNYEAKVLYDRLAELRSKISNMRKQAFLEGKDEFSVENLAFKELRNSGYIEKTMDMANAAYDDIYSDPVK